VLVKLKFSKFEYTGKLISIDSYMNLQLANTDEHGVNDKGEKSEQGLGDVLVRFVISRSRGISRESSTNDNCRCNNLLWICEKPAQYKGRS
jgi:LSM domain